MAQVPVGRRSLFAERRYAVLGIAGVAATLLMVLVIDGVFAGAMQRVTRYIDTSSADVFVAQAGVRNMHMASSTVALESLDDVRELGGVRWAEPILYESGALAAGDARQVAYVIGYRPARPGGPVELIAGSEPGPGEIVLDDRAANTLGVGVGDTVEALGRDWTVSGLTTGMDNIANSVSYVRFDDFARARGAPGTASFILVHHRESRRHRRSHRRRYASGSDDQGRVRRRGADRGAGHGGRADGDHGKRGVLDRPYRGQPDALHRHPVAPARDRRAQGTRCERAAVGAQHRGSGRLDRRYRAARCRPGGGRPRQAGGVSLALEGRSVLRVAVGAAALAVVGGVTPLVKVSRIDPATVFRR